MATRAITIQNAVRQGQLVVPANGNGFSVPAQDNDVEVHATMDQTTLDNPATQLTFTVQYRRAVTDPWTTFLGGPQDGVFTGGPNQGKSGGPTINPGFTFSMPSDRATIVFQLLLDIPNPISVGATVDLS